MNNELGDLRMNEDQKQKRTETSIKKVTVNPNFLTQYVKEDTSLDLLREHRVVPRFKLIQATTDEDLKKAFGEGSVIVRPGDALICKHEGEGFNFVPLFFFLEWAKWRDLKGNGSMILERTHDKASKLAELSRDAKTRKELYSGMDNVIDEAAKMYYQYVEHIRFIGVIYGDHPLVGQPVTLSFERGEWVQGKNFISAVAMRRQIISDGDDKESIPVPLWAQVWNLGSIHHAPDATRKWYGFKFEAADPSIIQPEEAPAMQALHEEYKELFAKQRLSVSDDEQESPEDASNKAAVKANPDF